MSGKAQKKRQQGKDNSLKNSSGAEWLIIGGLMLLTFLTFLPSLNAGFVNWDDYHYVRDNADIKTFSLANIRHFFNTSVYVEGNYHPLTVLTYVLEYHFIKLNPFYYHLDNLLLHLGNVVLVYFFIKMLTRSISANQAVSTSQLIAAITALLFAIHPLKVESVTWIAERKDVLYTLFFLASLICYLKYLQTAGARFYFFSIVFFFLSILSKGQAVVLAPVLVLIDFFTKRKFTGKIILDKIPFFILAIIFGIIAMNAQHTSLTNQRLISFTLAERLMIGSYGIVMYLYKFLLPIQLSCFYQYPMKIAGFFFAAPFIVILCAIAITVVIKKSNSIVAAAITFGALFFLSTVSIVLQILHIGNAVIAERYTYLPYIGIFFSVGSVYAYLEKNSKWRNIARVTGVAVILLFVILTFNQAKVWKDSKTLWTSVLKNYPTTALAYENLGRTLYENNEFEPAFEEFSKAISYNDTLADAHYNRGTVYLIIKKDNDAAVADFSKAIKYKRNYAEACYNRGLAYENKSKLDSAFADYSKAIELKSDYYEAYVNRGRMSKNASKFTEAIDDFNVAIKLQPNQDKAWFNRGHVFFIQKKHNDALNDFSKAIALNENYGAAYCFKGLSEMNLGKKDIACSDIQRAIKLGFQAANEIYTANCR